MCAQLRENDRERIGEGEKGLGEGGGTFMSC